METDPDSLRKLWNIKIHRRQPIYLLAGDINFSSEKSLESLGNKRRGRH